MEIFFYPRLDSNFRLPFEDYTPFHVLMCFEQEDSLIRYVFLKPGIFSDIFVASLQLAATTRIVFGSFLLLVTLPCYEQRQN